MVDTQKTPAVKHYKLRDFKDSILIAANLYSPEKTKNVIIDKTDNPNVVSLTKLLQNLAQDYVNFGTTVLTGFAGQVFSEEQAKLYRDAKSKLEQEAGILYNGENLSAYNFAIKLGTEEANDVRKRFSDIADGDKRNQELVEAGKSFLQLQDDAIERAKNRYNEINKYAHNKQLIDLGRVVLGVHDNPEWDIKQEMKRGVEEVRHGHKKEGKLRFAYFGGYNYHEDEYEQDAPDELIMKTAPDVLSDFLEKTPFDVLLFSGARKVIKDAIDTINLSKSNKLLGSNKSGIRDRIIVVTDPTQKIPKIEYDGVNTIVTGANYCDKGKLVLIDPMERNVAILRYFNGGDISHADKEKGKKGMLDDAYFELIKARNFASGKGFDIQDITRKHMSLVGRISSSLITMAGLEAVSAPETRGILRKTVPYLVAGAVGAAAGALGYAFATSHVKEESASTELTDTIKRLEQDLKEKGRDLTDSCAELQKRDKILDSMRKNIDSVRKKLEETTK